MTNFTAGAEESSAPVRLVKDLPNKSRRKGKSCIGLEQPQLQLGVLSWRELFIPAPGSSGLQNQNIPY